MILIIGGAFAGKFEFAKSLGFQDEEIFNLINDQSSVEELAKMPVILCREMGCGLVPVDREFREQREEMGRLCCKLAEKASAVYRVTCGIGQQIK